MRNLSRNSSGILSRNPSRSEELAFRKAVFDLLKDLETESGASPDATASMDIRAARAVVSMLFETFFSQERRDRIEQSGTNPLVEAARFDNLPVMEYILDRNLIDINQTSAGYTPLMKAVLANCESAARLLISRGADTGMRSPSGKTASDYAAAHGNEQIKALFS